MHPDCKNVSQFQQIDYKFDSSLLQSGGSLNVVQMHDVRPLSIMHDYKLEYTLINMIAYSLFVMSAIAAGATI